MERPVLPTRPLAPLLLEPNRFPRFYLGGTRIDALRGGTPLGTAGPEDWIGSAASSLAGGNEGVSRLLSGELLRDVIDRDPEAFLGPDHVARHGSDPALLVKLLDAGERLPVHSHPGRAFARERLGQVHGKTEAWIIVEAEPGAAVRLGLRETVDRDTVRGWLASQDSAAMLDALHEVPVFPGDVLLVPAGTLHAIDAGILLVELQEPSDQALLLEWERFGIDSGSEHMQLGWEIGLESVELGVTDPATLVRRAESIDAGPGARDLMPSEANPYFRAQRVRPGAGEVAVEPGFAVLVVLDGLGTLRPATGPAVELARGDAYLVPFAAGPTTLSGADLDVIRCRPPASDAPEGAW
jgi:mannose-6-phosphate isomerase